MCLIAVKPVGVLPPTKKQFRDWFVEHPDGAGMAFNDKDNKIHILKGALNLKDFIAMHRKMAEIIRPYKVNDINVIYHFRQATEGIIAPHNCHPFPITKDKVMLAGTDVICDSAIAHNGIIYDYATYKDGKWNYTQDDYTTDTQKFIEQYLVDIGDAIYNEGVRKLICKYTSSKFALLNSRGVYLIGDFICDKGMYYSNYTYLNLPATNYSLKPIPVSAASDSCEDDNYYYHSGNIKRDSDYYKSLYFNDKYSDDEQVFCEYCGEDITYKESTIICDAMLCPKCADYFGEKYDYDKGWF